MCWGYGVHTSEPKTSSGDYKSRNYTNKVHLRGLRKNTYFQPTEVGFACVVAVSNRRFNLK